MCTLYIYYVCIDIYFRSGTDKNYNVAVHLLCLLLVGATSSNKSKAP